MQDTVVQGFAGRGWRRRVFSLWPKLDGQCVRGGAVSMVRTNAVTKRSFPTHVLSVVRLDVSYLA